MLILSIILVPDSPVRTMLGIPFLLLFPGYTLISTLFPKKSDLGEIERFSLSIGLSIAIVPLVGLLLNYTPWGIRLYPVVASLFILTLLLSIASNYRRAKLTPNEKTKLAMPINKITWNKVQKTDKLFVVGVVITLIVVSSFCVYLASAPKIGDRFSEFSILGSNGKLADYPVNLTLGEKGKVILGITNHEYETVAYKINISLNNQTIKTFEKISLKHEMSWTQNFTFTPEITGEKLSLDFHLYKEGTDEPYRALKLWVNVRPQ
jgi:uncharacterized membrane protein